MLKVSTYYIYKNKLLCKKKGFLVKTMLTFRQTDGYMNGQPAIGSFFVLV